MMSTSHLICAGYKLMAWAIQKKKCLSDLIRESNERAFPKGISKRNLSVCVAAASLHSVLPKLERAKFASQSALFLQPFASAEKAAAAAMSSKDSTYEGYKVDLSKWEVEKYRLPEDDLRVKIVKQYKEIRLEKQTSAGLAACPQKDDDE